MLIWRSKILQKLLNRFFNLYLFYKKTSWIESLKTLYHSMINSNFVKKLIYCFFLIKSLDKKKREKVKKELSYFSNLNKKKSIKNKYLKLLLLNLNKLLQRHKTHKNANHQSPHVTWESQATDSFHILKKSILECHLKKFFS